MSCIDSYCRQIIRPPRRTYSQNYLGPQIRILKDIPIIRVDFTFTSRNLKLQASYFIKDSKYHRCLIYLHGNASCRLEGLQYIDLLMSTMNVCVLDFAGCGLSDGDYITMGAFESQDIKELMNYIIDNFGDVDEFILWGRSMGAATALLLSNDPRINVYIIDSAFMQFTTLIKELGEMKFGMFSFMMNAFIPFLRNKIINLAHFDINQLNPIEQVTVNSNNKRFFFIAGKHDQLISPRHSQILYDQCKCHKQLEICEGNHNTNRPIESIKKIINFINLIQIEEVQNHEYQMKSQKYFKLGEEWLKNYQIQQQQEEEDLVRYSKEMERKSVIKSYKNQQRDLSDLDSYI